MLTAVYQNRFIVEILENHCFETEQKEEQEDLFFSGTNIYDR
jgi:hypothetical protein